MRTAFGDESISGQEFAYTYQNLGWALENCNHLSEAKAADQTSIELYELVSDFKNEDERKENTGCLKSKYTLSNLIFFSGTDYKALIFSENIAFITTNFKYSLHLPPTHIITGRITQEMRCKIAVWQEAYGSV